MNIKDQIKNHIISLPKPKQTEMEALHQLVLEEILAKKLWFLDGKNSEGKIVSNPSIGYGSYTIKYADGTSKEFYQIGLSANTSGISVYLMGIKDKTYLARTYGDKIGKASVSGYCIKFKTLKEINTQILKSAIKFGAEARD